MTASTPERHATYSRESVASYARPRGAEHTRTRWAVPCAVSGIDSHHDATTTRSDVRGARRTFDDATRLIVGLKRNRDDLLLGDVD
jgi:hypothetical protein